MEALTLRAAHTPPSPPSRPPPLSTPPRSIWRHTLYLLGATYLARAVTALRSVLNARWLGPELYGFWGSVSLLISFGHYLHGGLQDVTARDIPTSRRQGRPDAAQESVSQTLSVFGLMLGLASILLWVKAWWLPSGTPSVLRVGWWVAGLVLPLEALWSFEQLVARADERFASVSRNLVVTSVVSLLLTYWLVTRYQLPGLFVVAVATPGVGLWWLRRNASFRWRIAWSWSRLAAMLRSGWPLLAIAFIVGALSWVDQVIVLKMLGTTQFGYYALGGMLAQLCLLFPTIVASVMEPRVYFDYASQRQPSDVRAHVCLQLKALALIMPLGLACLDAILPTLIRVWLPAYEPAVPAMRILIWGSFLSGFTMCVRSFIVTLNRQHQVLPVYVVAVAINALLSALLAMRGLGLAGVAIGTVVAAAVCSGALALCVFRWLGDAPSRVVVRALVYSLPCLGLVLIMEGPAWARTLWPSSGAARAMAVGQGLCLAAYAVSVGLMLPKWLRQAPGRSSSPSVNAPAASGVFA